MKTKKLGRTDLEFTVIGLGTWAQGGPGWKFGWGQQDDRDSIAAIHRAADLGINWIDTAAVYGTGHAEEVVGRALKGMVERPMVATKCCRVYDGQGRISSRFDRQSVRAEAEASLRRLGLERIDLYQMHWPGADPETQEAWSAMAELVKEGKVRHIGVSNFSVEQLKLIEPIHPPASLQPPYSMLNRGVEDGLLEFCGRNKIGVIVYSPMQKGILTDRFTREFVGNLPPDDHRRKDPRFQEPELSANLQLVAGLRALADKRGLSVARLALGWTLRRSEVTAAIVGARNPGQIEETAAAAEAFLSGTDLAEIENLLRVRQRQLG